MLFFNPYVLGPQERIDRQQITRNGARSLLLISPAKPINTERYIAFKKELINRTESKEPFMDSAVFDEDLVSNFLAYPVSQLLHFSKEFYNAAYR